MDSEGASARQKQAPAVAPAVGRVGAFGSLSPAARMLVVNQFFISLGFTMVVPFLAIYLSRDLRLAETVVSLIVGLRTLSSQGMLLLGGSLGDRLGSRPMIIFGCALRILAYGLFALSTELWAVIVATIGVGLATSFFNPAVRTYLAAETTGHRAEAFGLFNIAGNTGGLLGPVIGGFLITLDFRYVACAGAVLFAILTVAQLFLLPARVMEKPEGTMLANWVQVARNGRFALFTLAGATFALMQTQIYFAMVMEAWRVTHRSDSATLIYLVSALFAASTQVKLTRWCQKRWSSGKAMAIGTAIMGLGWAPMMLSAPLTAGVAQATSIPVGVVAMAPVLLGALVMTLGSTIANPFMMELMPIVGSERMLGTYYGYFSLIGGVAAAGGSALIGAVWNADHAMMRWVPFAILVVVGLAGGAILQAMQRAGALEPRATPA